MIKKKRPSMAVAVFAFYCLLLAWIVLFKASFSLAQLKMLCGDRTLNFIPFYYDRDVGSIHLREVVLNVFVFIPFGVYMRVFGVRFWRGVLYGVLTSFFLEACQFAFGIGGADVTDLITNTLGTVVGCYFYMGPLWILGSKKSADRFINIFGVIGAVAFLLLAAVLFLAN